MKFATKLFSIASLFTSLFITTPALAQSKDVVYIPAAVPDVQGVYVVAEESNLTNPKYVVGCGSKAQVDWLTEDKKTVKIAVFDSFTKNNDTEPDIKEAYKVFRSVCGGGRLNPDAASLPAVTDTHPLGSENRDYLLITRFDNYQISNR